MVGDYISAAIPPGSAQAVPVVVLAKAPAGSTFNEATYSGQVAVTGGSRPLADDPVVSSGRTPVFRVTAQ
jgi:hypothetical protein